MNQQSITHLKQLTQPLLTWYKANARDLPWRHTYDPYRIWISEIMLQQTRVAAVLGYYARFLEAFPTIQDLAEAPEEKLMKLWEGLGYYSRARNLQKAAKLVVEKYNGKFPDTYDELLALPGVGEYTAGAISAAAFGLREPAVDGNVLRTVSRICDIHDDINDSKVKASFRSAVAEILPETPEEMHIFNQAMMELGATVCPPKGTPQCDLCPATKFCLAKQRGTISELPVKSPKKARRVEEKTVFVLLRDGNIALHKRDDAGLLAGLWEFPNVEGKIEENAVFTTLEQLNLRIVDWKKQLSAKHIFSHVEWHMTGYIVQVLGEGIADFVWADATDFNQYAIPSAFARFTDEAKEILAIK